MGTSISRWGALTGAAICIFTVSTIVGLQLIPGPPSQVDYLVVGSISTLLSMVVFFAMLLTTMMKLPNPFYRKRMKGTVEPDPPQN